MKPRYTSERRTIPITLFVAIDVPEDKAVWLSSVPSVVR